MPKHDARRRMLLLWAGLAIAVAGVQVHLIGPAGAMTVPLASALISIALAGALIALGLTRLNARHEAVTEVKDPKTQDGASVDPAARGQRVFCNSQLDEYFAGIKSELSQADRLVGDAAGNLVTGFRYISKLTRLHQDIARAIADTTASATGEPIGQMLVRQAVVADQIEQEVSAVATSLQFGDLVAQLLNHTMARVEALGMALDRIEQLDAGQRSGELGYKPQRIHEGIAGAIRAANAASRSKPVVQHGMQKGEVELF